MIVNALQNLLARKDKQKTDINIIEKVMFEKDEPSIKEL